jgi:hypothetical protein
MLSYKDESRLAKGDQARQTECVEANGGSGMRIEGWLGGRDAYITDDVCSSRFFFGIEMTPNTRLNIF